MQKSGDGTTISGNRIIAQKQNGLYAVRYHPVGGVPRPEKFAELYAAVEPMEDVELRIGPDEEIYIINLTGKEAEKILELTSDSARNLFETSVACIGSTVCQIGLRDSQGALTKWKNIISGRACCPGSTFPAVPPPAAPTRSEHWDSTAESNGSTARRSRPLLSMSTARTQKERNGSESSGE